MAQASEEGGNSSEDPWALVPHTPLWAALWVDGFILLWL